MTAIIDYGVGNLFSLKSSFAAIGEQAEVTGDAAKLADAERVILPGVGAFPDAYAQLEKRALPAVLHRMAEKKPILGICLGMQLLMSSSAEGRLTLGLDFVPGKVERIPTTLKLPHIGWNALHFATPSPLFEGIDEGTCFYFVHSYRADCADEYVCAKTEYGVVYPSAVCRNNVFGVQFHPEKSGAAGLRLLKNFCAL